MAAQGIVFLFSCAVGAILGVVYDVFRIIRIAFNSKWISVFFQDFIFCIFSAVSVILLVYYTNSGIVRWFSLFGCFLCFVLYHMTVGILIMFVSRKIIDFIKKVLKFLKKITVTPIKMTVLFIINQLKRFSTFIFRLHMRIRHNLYYRTEKRKFSNSASYGFGLYTVSSSSSSKMFSKLKKNKKIPKYISNMIKEAGSEINKSGKPPKSSELLKKPTTDNLYKTNSARIKKIKNKYEVKRGIQ